MSFALAKLYFKLSSIIDKLANDAPLLAEKWITNYKKNLDEYDKIQHINIEGNILEAKQKIVISRIISGLTKNLSEEIEKLEKMDLSDSSEDEKNKINKKIAYLTEKIKELKTSIDHEPKQTGGYKIEHFKNLRQEGGRILARTNNSINEFLNKTKRNINTKNMKRKYKRKTKRK